jgi:hypothetical protein
MTVVINAVIGLLLLSAVIAILLRARQTERDDRPRLDAIARLRARRTRSREVRLSRHRDK